MNRDIELEMKQIKANARREALSLIVWALFFVALLFALIVNYVEVTPPDQQSIEQIE